jgi:hypothetical protein
MEIGSIFVGLALLAVVAFVLAQPFIENQGVRESQVTQADALAAEREQVLDALRDLDFDHAMGKLAAEDYTPQRTQLMARGVELLKQLDAVAPRDGERRAAPLPVNGAPDGLEAQMERAVAARRKSAPAAVPLDPEAQMEAAIAARRASAAGPACAQCGTPAHADDRFCANCGAALAQPLPPAVAGERGTACAQCGTPFQPGDRFCGKCGAKVPDAAAAGAA